MESPAGKETINRSPPPHCLFGKSLRLFPGPHRPDLGSETATTHLQGGSSEICDGLVLGQDGKPERPRTRGQGSLLEELAQRGPLQRGHGRSCPCPARCRPTPAGDSSRVRASET